MQKLGFSALHITESQNWNRRFQNEIGSLGFSIWNGHPKFLGYSNWTQNFPTSLFVECVIKDRFRIFITKYYQSSDVHIA